MVDRLAYADFPENECEPLGGSGGRVLPNRFSRLDDGGALVPPAAAMVPWLVERPDVKRPAVSCEFVAAGAWYGFGSGGSDDGADLPPPPPLPRSGGSDNEEISDGMFGSEEMPLAGALHRTRTDIIWVSWRTSINYRSK